MSLELGPDTERRVREYAACEGISIEELINRAFPPRAYKDPGEPAEDRCINLHIMLARRYAETDNPCLKHKWLSQLFAGEESEAPVLSTEDYATELKFWEDYDRERFSCLL